MTEQSWRKSSRSTGSDDCVEVVNSLDELRDTKHPTGPTLRGDVRSMVRAIQADDITP